jgi:multidrug resistance efflux pump
VRKPRPIDAEQSSRAAAENEVENSDPLEVIGAIIIEQIESDLPREVIAPRIDLVYEHSARALSNALDHSNLFLMPVWRAISRLAWIIRARTLPKTLVITGIVLTLLICLVAIPWDYNMKTKGALQPKIKREVFVEQPGIIKKVYKSGRDVVKAGELLMVMENPDLEVQLTETIGQLSTTREELQSIARLLNEPEIERQKRVELIGQQSRLRIRIKSLELQKEILDQKKKELEIRAPIDGVVITWDAKKTLEGRPVTTGQVLMTIADPTGPWELELYMPERRAGKVDYAQSKIKEDLPVKYVLATEPDTTFNGTVNSVDTSLILHEEEGHVMRVRVDIEEGDLANPRPGASVTAKVYCGRRPVGWCWFHEAVEWVQAWWF